MMRLGALAAAAALLLLSGCAAPRPNALMMQSMESHDPTRVVVVTFRNPSGPAVPRAGSTVRDYDGSSNYSVSTAAQSNVRTLAQAYGLQEIAGWPITLLGVHCVMFEIPSGADRDALLTRLRHDSRVESAQPLNSFNVLGTVPGGSAGDQTGKAPLLTTSPVAGYNDPYRGLQHNLDEMGVSEAHRWSRGEGVRVAVIDTGIDARHPDLAGRIVREQNLVADSEAEVDYERDRHGTAVAGIIAAVGNNSQGIVGIAPAARLYALRACWPAAPNAARAMCNTFTLAKALAVAIDSQANVVNLSLTGPADPLLTRLVSAGIRRGIVFVGAVAPPGSDASFPTGIDGVIGVDSSGSRNADATVLHAPGMDVLTLVPDGRYDFMSGSSFAAASVSGGIALLLAREPKLRPHELQSLLARSTRTDAATGTAGAGASVNLCGALSLALGAGGCAE